jgi:uncharacterized 2Fe-2S/4Fe-4S cluster protein (DUF4445 family)
MKHNVKVTTGSRQFEETAEHGMNLLEFLQKNSIIIDSPCGGNGRCGKCRVKIKGHTQPPSEKEAGLLGENAINKGFRLACYIKIESDIEVIVDAVSTEASIKIDGRQRDIEFLPVVEKKHVQLDKPDIDDQISDLDRVLAASGGMTADDFPDFLKKLPEVLRKNNYSVTLAGMGGKLAAVEPGDTTKKIFGIAVDIGTTTVAAYLYSLSSGEKIDVHSVLNPQKKYGADVISRIEYAMRSEEARKAMTKTIVDCVNEMTSVLAQRNKIQVYDIYSCVFAGNTTMTHFLMGLDARNIAVSPFIPVTTRLHIAKAVSLGIEINPFGSAVILPCVAGYIGADTVAAVLSSGLYESDGISLLLDIGTNGEIVLGCKDWMYSCSTAAGPAFEGANIKNGVGGIKGAIDRVFFDEGFGYTTIQNTAPVGVCGSGLVDAIAGMYDTGVVDETGRIADDDEALELPGYLSERIVEIDGMRAFLLAAANETAIDSDVAITQKDIRELQNAKAAIAAGVRVLVKRSGIELDDIEKVYLAGGFGSYIDIDATLTIGLLPSELEGRIEAIGNAAGQGAVEALLSEKMLEETKKIRERIKYIELSSSADFTGIYIDSMILGKNT